METVPSKFKAEERAARWYLGLGVGLKSGPLANLLLGTKLGFAWYEAWYQANKFKTEERAARLLHLLRRRAARLLHLLRRRPHHWPIDFAFASPKTRPLAD